MDRLDLMPRHSLETEYVRMCLLPGTAKAAVSEQRASLFAGEGCLHPLAMLETLWLTWSLRKLVGPLPSVEDGTHDGDLLWLNEGMVYWRRNPSMAPLTRDSGEADEFTDGHALQKSPFSESCVWAWDHVSGRKWVSLSASTAHPVKGSQKLQFISWQPKERPQLLAAGLSASLVCFAVMVAAGRQQEGRREPRPREQQLATPASRARLKCKTSLAPGKALLCLQSPGPLPSTTIK